ncbi:TetR/AcrR family transcriptional regulator [Kitasatospora sp. NPDC092039]|uniref:TetR/AcrR family transcriptional regulator n=1 Tax=Kitasatospora sp. NPDC092039 TaxID=3364086 RepID=UPI00382FB12D
MSEDATPQRRRRSGTAAPRGGTRGNRVALNRDLIITTALEIIDGGGLDSLSMRKLGAQLGVDPMAVYYHLPNKAALFDGVVEAIQRELGAQLDALDLDGGDPADWADRATLVMQTYRDVLRRHPHALPVISTRPVRSPEALAPFERILAVFTDSGIALPAAVHMVTCVVEFTIGHVLAEAGEPFGGETPYEADALDQHASDLPHVAEAWQDQEQAIDPDTLYELGVRSMLEGMNARLSAAR